MTRGPGDASATPNACLRPGASLTVGAEGVVIELDPGQLRLGALDPVLVGAFERLSGGTSAAGDITDSILDTAGPVGLATWVGLLGRLAAAKCLEYRVSDGDRRVATGRPGPGYRPMASLPSQRLSLSRFAYLRPSETGMVLDSPLSTGPIEIRDPRAGIIVSSLATPAYPAELASSDRGCRWAVPLLHLLTDMGFALETDAEGATAETRSEVLGRWEFHDLALHGRVFRGRPDLPVGDTGRRGVARVPAMKPPMSGSWVDLPHPAADQGSGTLYETIDERRSLRAHGAPPITIAQLGEFLYTVARAREETDEPGIRRRVYPGGGARHPLEIYPLVGACEGLDPGVYRYDPARHRLDVLSDRGGLAKDVLRAAAAGMEDGRPPQVWLVITARIGRLSEKYEGIAYLLAHQEVGVLYEAMYLVATAMGLAPCAYGFVDGLGFARAIGVDPLEESAVGGFLLGSPA
ncbi:MAG: SagB family peptide dehydrogenase [Gemmatimonadota bacterium]|nr:SagB family peptide dehydrogenase [Gemmatimonadota bacterium]